MDTNVPVLNPQQIEDLNHMIQNILQQNGKSIDIVLNQVIQVQSASIMKLYNLTIQEWVKKQKIIDNLCHFALTMMSTVQFLWGQKNDNQDRLSNAEVVIGTLNKHIQQLGEQNLTIKNKIHEVETHIESISGQKQKIEELYRSQSCCNFPGQSFFSQVPIHGEKSQLCCQHANSNNEHNSHLLQQFNKTLEDKQSQISTLKDQKKQLQKRLQNLMEENQLAKMQVQLAEIAVKDALSYRQSSMISSNRSDPNSSYEIYTTKSHAQFLNGELQCFSNLQDSFNFDRKNLIIKELAMSEQNFRQNNSVQNQICLTSRTKHQIQDVTSAENPFKKKLSKLHKDQQRCYTEYKDNQLNTQEKKLKIQSILIKNSKTVSLQCDLIKDIPKIKLFQKNSSKTQAKNIKNKANLQSLLQKPKKQDRNTKDLFKKSKNKHILSKSQIIRKEDIPAKTNKKEQKLNDKKEEKEPKNENSLTRLYNFFSSKIISQRIKVK